MLVLSACITAVTPAETTAQPVAFCFSGLELGSLAAHGQA